MISFDANDVTSRIWGHIHEVFFTQDAAAQAYGISTSYLSDVLSGRRAPGKKLLDALNMKAVIYYEDKD